MERGGVRQAAGLFLLAVFGPGMVAFGVWTLRRPVARGEVPAVESLFSALMLGPEPEVWTLRSVLFHGWTRVVLGLVFTVLLAFALFTFSPE